MGKHCRRIELENTLPARYHQVVWWWCLSGVYIHQCWFRDDRSDANVFRFPFFKFSFIVLINFIREMIGFENAPNILSERILCSHINAHYACS